MEIYWTKSGGIGLGGYFWGKADVAEKIGKRTREAREQADMYDLRAGVYSSALENILDAVNEREWIGNDILVAELNFNKYRRNALVDFRNVGVENIPNWDFEIFFENLSRKLSELKFVRLSQIDWLIEKSNYLISYLENKTGKNPEIMVRDLEEKDLIFFPVRVKLMRLKRGISQVNCPKLCRQHKKHTMVEHIKYEETSLRIGFKICVLNALCFKN